MQRTGKQLGQSLLIPLFCILLVCFRVSEADQHNASLPDLFDQLKQAESNSDTQDVQRQIWAAWLEAPDLNSDNLMSQLTSAMSIGNYALALRLCDQLIDTYPEFSEAWNKRATIHYIMGNHGYSVADIKETLLLEPRHFGALSGLGAIFMASGNAEAAVDAFESALDISPSSSNAIASLARAKALIGTDI